MKLKQEELIKTCTELLLKLCDLVEARNSINFYDINISSEFFFLSIHLTQLLVTSDLKRQIGAFTAASARRSKRVS